jgi:NAD(P) transhydrogenase|tara:strand:- start:17 stop:496 length:480 start_codon:yes stop_codon:yes gene_type:complete
MRTTRQRFRRHRSPANAQPNHRGWLTAPQLKWILSAGPTTTKTKGEFALDHEDVAVRGMMVVQNGVATWPWTPPAPPPPPPPPEAKPEIVLTDEDYKEIYSTSARQSTYAAAAVLGVGLLSPNPAFSSMLSTFALSGVIGYQVLARCATGTLLSAPAHV